MRRVGESVWAPISRKPLCSGGSLPISKAARLAPSRTTYTRSPGDRPKSSPSCTRRKPSASSLRLVAATAWNGEGEASMYESRSLAKASVMARSAYQSWLGSGLAELELLAEDQLGAALLVARGAVLLVRVAVRTAPVVGREVGAVLAREAQLVALALFGK